MVIVCFSKFNLNKLILKIKNMDIRLKYIFDVIIDNLWVYIIVDTMEFGLLYDWIIMAMLLENLGTWNPSFNVFIRYAH